MSALLLAVGSDNTFLLTLDASMWPRTISFVMHFLQLIPEEFTNILAHGLFGHQLLPDKEYVNPSPRDRGPKAYP